jgi:hypothetical protein
VHLAVELGREHDVLAAGVAGDRASDELLGGAGAVDVGGVPEGDAEFDRLLEERAGGVLVEDPAVPPRDASP